MKDQVGQGASTKAAPVVSATRIGCTCERAKPPPRRRREHRAVDLGARALSQIGRVEGGVAEAAVIDDQVVVAALDMECRGSVDGGLILSTAGQQ